MNRYKRLISGVLILSLCFMVFSCDYVNNRTQKEISLRGENITAKYQNKMEKISNTSIKTNKIKIYSVNKKSPKYKKIKKMLEKRLAKHLKNMHKKHLRGQAVMSLENSNQELSPQIQMEDSQIIENTDTGNMILGTPISTSGSQDNTMMYERWENNTITTQSYYVTVHSSIGLNEIESNHDLASQATLNFQITDQSGLIGYSYNGSPPQQYITSSSNASISSYGCLGTCINIAIHNMNPYALLFCLLDAIGCILGILIPCVAHCLFFSSY